MAQSLATRMYPQVGGRSVTAARVINIVRTAGVSAAAWIAWILSDGRDRLMTRSLVVLGAAGGVLAGLSPNGPAVAVGCVAAFSAGARLSTVVSLGVTAETVAGFLVTGLILRIPAAELLGYAWAFIGLWTVALTRNEFLIRALQAERTLAETRRVREAETRAAALAERARIARDLHDVLAHSLAAVSVNLQAADGLLSSDTGPCTSARRRSRRTSTGSSPRPAPATAARPSATPTPTATPTPPPASPKAT
jgi:signal transduction histidine kinase